MKPSQNNWNWWQVLVGYFTCTTMFLKEDRWSMNTYLEFVSVHSIGDTTNTCSVLYSCNGIHVQSQLLSESCFYFCCPFLYLPNYHTHVCVCVCLCEAVCWGVSFLRLWAFKVVTKDWGFHWLFVNLMQDAVQTLPNSRKKALVL